MEKPGGLSGNDDGTPRGIGLKLGPDLFTGLLTTYTTPARLQHYAMISTES